VIGVHQVMAMAVGGGPVPDAGRTAQRTSAECQRYLGEMGVDLQVWVHAMETPKERLYTFSRDQLLALRLVTASVATGSAASAEPRRSAR
jgi:hypothetical protein